MALTGKTIGELSLLQFPTNDTLIPVELSGDTYHIAFSAVNYTETTYSDLVTGSQLGELSPGSYYLMTDFQTCYDQPNYNNVKSPIFSGNYMTGDTEPILLLAISTTEFSPTVYSTLYPQDKITYDITWDTTEVTEGSAKGRITERIDEFNNRTDYDHRTILFKRYNGYSYNEDDVLGGLVGISGLTGTTGVLYGDTGTTFNSNLTTGSLVAVTNLNPSIFEVLSVQSDSLAIISGVSISDTSNSFYYSAFDDGIINYYQPNIRQNEVFEYTTFGDALDNNVAINNYVGNYTNLYFWNENPFLLANNVFISGPYINNTIGNDSYNNTFNDDCDSNQIGDGFYNNSMNDDFDGNIIGDYFYNNYITSNFNDNRIGGNFNGNILIGGSFYRNNIGNDFNNNVYTNGDFQNNEIGNQFNNNKIYDDFYNNDIGNGYNGNDTYRNFYRNLIGNGFNNNNIYSDFYENEIGQTFNSNNISILTDRGEYDFSGNRIGVDFQSNTIKNDFRNNNILNYFNGNNIQSTFNSNTISDQFTQNNIYNAFNENSFGENVNLNIFGNSNNIGVTTFSNNTIGGDFLNNNISGNTQYNTIGFNANNNTVYWDMLKNTMLTEFEGNTIGGVDNLGGSFEYNQIENIFKGNDIQGNFTNNQVKTNFKSNEIFGEFSYNNVGYYFSMNTLSGDTTNNTIGDDFEFNNTYGSFKYNTIGTNFYSNEVQDGFGFGSDNYQGNRIGNNFYDNNIGEYFYNNTIPDNFTNNIIGNYFQWNIVDTTVNGVDFTTYYGVISAITYSATGTTATDGSYSNIGGTTNGGGVDASFGIDVISGSVTNVSITNYGKLYQTGNTITILGTQIGGTDVIDDIIITVTGVVETPPVYETFTCHIFERQGGIKRLSYYDDTDTLIVSTLNND